MSRSKKTQKAATKSKSTRKSKAEAPIAVETAPAEITKTTKRAKTDKPKHTSALDCAAQVLSEARAPMRCKEMITAMQTQGLWSSPNGKTPEATLYSAIIREITIKGVSAHQNHY